MPATTNKSSGQKQDAIDLLTADHAAVDKLFKQYEKLADDGDDQAKEDCVQQICTALTVHATIEEEIFYPAAREVLDEEDILDEAEVEHDGIKSLVADLEGMSPEDELYDAKVTVLGEYVKHHVREEQDDMFPKVKKAEVDTIALGARLSARKKELEEEEAPAMA